MSLPVIEVAGVQKSYRRTRKPAQKALDGLDLTVEEGGVFGFLGPNGSGKTTTIRILLGLARADAGQVRLLGHDVPRELPKVIDQVGALVETPQMFPAFSGRRNLELLGGVIGIGRQRVDEVLELVGLSERAGDRVKGYSLGMRQRLGIAAALLKSPRMLILDEPSNGLDPAGIREIRELLRRLGREGVTVFVSSHLLGEVEQMCDHVAILARGRLVMSGTVPEIVAATRGGPGDVRVVVQDIGAGHATLVAAGFLVSATPDHLLVHEVADAANITRALVKKRQYVSELTPVAANLESVFLELTEAHA
ncbi:MAG TPA: ABC transporter ATP-binding protein [Mycobacteriales bacterium]|nr:ABC transporter ATP-binding protein [Mycobacteriales bacterium]